MITIIAAITAGKGAIGRNGDMIHHLRDDLRRFKELTTGHTVVMGRKTFESLPKGALPDRRNIVITRQADYQAPGAERASSLEEALEMASADDNIFIIGGGEIYRQSLPMADCMELTIIEGPEPTDADTFFPSFDPEQWQLSEMGDTALDSRTGIPYRFATFSRVK